MALEFIHDIRGSDGRTAREINLEKNHSIPMGALVEIRGNKDWQDWHGCRLYVIDYSRDCDGTPMYVLGPKREGKTPERETHGGFVTEELQIVEAPEFRNIK